MSPAAHDLVARLCAERAGLRVAADAAVVSTRLAPLARREGFASVEDLVTAVRERDDSRLAWRTVEALAPAPTGFFRDPAIFEKLCEAAPARGRADRRLRVWIAGCGAGQDAYSLAMALEERAERPEVEIFATDLSEARLERAQAGLYTAYEVQRGLSARRLVRCFEKRADGFFVSPRLRNMVRWARVNLIEQVHRSGRFDVILCRGLLPNFTPAAQARISDTLAESLESDGRLLLGAGERAPLGWRASPNMPGAFTPAKRVKIAA